MSVGKVFRWPFFLVTAITLAIAALLVTASAPTSETLLDGKGTMFLSSFWEFEAVRGDTIRLSYRGEIPSLVSLSYIDSDTNVIRAYLEWNDVRELDATVEIEEDHDVWGVSIHQIGRDADLVWFSYEVVVERSGSPPLWTSAALGLQLSAVLAGATGAVFAAYEHKKRFYSSRSQEGFPGE